MKILLYNSWHPLNTVSVKVGTSRLFTMYMHTHVSQDRWTALHLAAQEGHEDVVDLLLEAKADPELKTKVIICV